MWHLPRRSGSSTTMIKQDSIQALRAVPQGVRSYLPLIKPKVLPGVSASLITARTGNHALCFGRPESGSLSPITPVSVARGRDVAMRTHEAPLVSLSRGTASDRKP